MPGLPDRIGDVSTGLVADTITGLSGLFVAVLIGLVLVASDDKATLPGLHV